MTSLKGILDKIMHDIECLKLALRKQACSPGGGTTPPPADCCNMVSDILVNLKPGDTLGKYKNSDTIPSAGWSFEHLMKDIAMDYVPPFFTSFLISIDEIVELGTTLTGTQSATWSMQLNNGVVSSVDIKDSTLGTTMLLGIPNTGNSSLLINTNKLDLEGETQVWQIVGNNTTGANIFRNYIVTARYQRYWGGVTNYPTDFTDGSANRAYVNNLNKGFQVPGPNTFNLLPGNDIDFVIFIPASKTLTHINDLGNLNADLLPEYTLVSSTVKINDAGGTPRDYKMYTLSIGAPYSPNSNHKIITD